MLDSRARWQERDIKWADVTTSSSGNRSFRSTWRRRLKIAPLAQTKGSCSYSLF